VQVCYCLFISVLFPEIHYQRERVGITLTGLTQPLQLQVRNWISNVIFCGLFLCSTIQGEK
jgi:hypothetical protein